LCPRNRKAGLTNVSPASPGERREEIKSIISFADSMPRKKIYLYIVSNKILSSRQAPALQQLNESNNTIFCTLFPSEPVEIYITSTNSKD